MRRRGPRLEVVCLFVLLATSLAEARDPRPPGRLYDVGGYRLHAIVGGRGAPAVVFLNGAGDYSVVWSLVRPKVSRFARTVAYDRAGDAWSDLGPTPRSMRQESFELHALLARAGVRPPYVLVGHSFGGLLARVYAAAYPRDVAGIVLVDATHEDTVLFMNGKPTRMRELATARPVPDAQTLQSSPPKPPTHEDLEQAELNLKVFGPPRIEPPFDRLSAADQRLQLWAASHPKLSASSDTYFAEELRDLHDARAANPHPLGDLPLVAITAGGGGGGVPPGMTAETWAPIADEKLRQKHDLATLSTRGVEIVDPTSGHHVHLENPRLVVDAIRHMVDAVRRHRP